jgi:phosphate transport system protein
MYELIIKGLKKELQDYAVFIENMVLESIKGIEQNDEKLLKNIITEYEPESDRIENKIEEHCIEIVAKFNPVAHDLREVIMIMKMSDDLERIGDHVENICESGIYIAGRKSDINLKELYLIGEKACFMIKKSILSFMEENPVIARNVLNEDQKVDELNKKIFKSLVFNMLEKPEMIPASMQIIRISHNFERIGDLATNLCEDIIYMEEGNMVRHKLGM